MFGVRGGEFKGPKTKDSFPHSPTQNLHEALWGKGSWNQYTRFSLPLQWSDRMLAGALHHHLQWALCTNLVCYSGFRSNLPQTR